MAVLELLVGKGDVVLLGRGWGVAVWEVYWPPDFETEAALSRLECTGESNGGE